jgi:hypothetical protein
MGSFSDIDKGSDKVLTRDEVNDRATAVLGCEVADLCVESIMNVADMDNTGTISPLEIMVAQFVTTDILNPICMSEEFSVVKKVVSEVMGKDPSHEQVKQAVHDLPEVLDIKCTSKIDREDAIVALGELKRRDLLR